MNSSNRNTFADAEKYYVLQTEFFKKFHRNFSFQDTYHQYSWLQSDITTLNCIGTNCCYGASNHIMHLNFHCFCLCCYQQSEVVCASTAHKKKLPNLLKLNINSLSFACRYLCLSVSQCVYACVCVCDFVFLLSMTTETF